MVSDMDPKLYAKMLEMYHACSKGGGGIPDMMWGSVSDMIKDPSPGSVWEDLGDYGGCWFQLGKRHLSIFDGDDLVYECDLEVKY